MRVKCVLRVSGAGNEATPAAKRRGPDEKSADDKNKSAESASEHFSPPVSNFEIRHYISRDPRLSSISHTAAKCERSGAQRMRW
jgi:hypothetical protein